MRDDTGVVVEELDGQLLLLRQGGSDVVHLDAVAALVWDLLAEPQTREDLAALVADTFSVEPDRVRTDLEPLLALLRDQGLVVPA